VTAIYDEFCRGHGVKVSQVNVLVLAAELGVARPAEVCSALHMDHSTVSRNVERMVSRGWLAYIEDEEDARARPFEITVEGKRLLQQLLPDWRKAQAKAKKFLGDETAKMLRKKSASIGPASSRPIG
jgi:DNA-binding MarR family transcriptional regulator